MPVARKIKSALFDAIQTFRISNLSNDINTLDALFVIIWPEIERVVATQNSPIKIQLTICMNVTHLSSEEIDAKIYLRSKAFKWDDNSGGGGGGDSEDRGNIKDFFTQLFQNKLQSYTDRSSNFRVNDFSFVDFDLLKYNRVPYNTGST